MEPDIVVNRILEFLKQRNSVCVGASHCWEAWAGKRHNYLYIVSSDGGLFA